jgi:hypothetical protein
MLMFMRFTLGADSLSPQLEKDCVFDSDCTTIYGDSYCCAAYELEDDPNLATFYGCGVIKEIKKYKKFEF